VSPLTSLVGYYINKKPQALVPDPDSSVDIAAQNFIGHGAGAPVVFIHFSSDCVPKPFQLRAIIAGVRSANMRLVVLNFKL
jgi:hypothetical protein